MAPAPIICDDKQSLLNSTRARDLQIPSIHEKEPEDVAFDDFTTTEWTGKRLTDVHELEQYWWKMVEPSAGSRRLDSFMLYDLCLPDAVSATYRLSEKGQLVASLIVSPISSPD